MTAIDKARWAQLSPLLDQLLDASQDERERRLAELRLSNPDLAHALGALLAQQAAVETEQFLEGQALPADVQGLAGRVIGNYTIDRPLGHGGMGSVWLAHRSDGRFEGQVAIKLLNLALVTRGGIERFRSEGNALARLAHPNIARLLDAGVDLGQPYLVLELVEGVPIDRWCAERSLGTEARIRLMMEVLHAVGHAHANLILHRDLKPSNILVTADGVPKLLDFGIAKLLDDGSSDAELTRRVGTAFTPGFASPEQKLGTAVTTATDVYSLGVLLQRLLSDPASSAGSAASTGGHRPARPVPADVGNIITKATREDPAQRYQTVAAFAEDLGRYLRQEPVLARPDALGYRARMFVRRNRVPVAIAAIFLGVISVGIATTLWQAREARLARDETLRQLERAEASNRFVQQMIAGTWGDQERISRDEFLARSESMALRELEGRPDQQAVVLQSLSAFYASAGDQRHALPLLDKAVALLPPEMEPSQRAYVECTHALVRWQVTGEEAALQTLRKWAADPAVGPATASECELHLARIARVRSDGVTALVHAERAKALLDKAPRVQTAMRASLSGELGYVYGLVGRGTESDQAFEAAVRLNREMGRQTSANTIAIINNWSTAVMVAGDIRRGLDLFDEAIRLSRSTRQGDPPPYTVSNRAQALLAAGRYDEAIKQADEAFGVAQRAGHRVFEVAALTAKAAAWLEQHQFAPAEPLLVQAQELAADLTPDNAVVLRLQLTQGRLRLLQGDGAAAIAALDPVIARFEERQPNAFQRGLALRWRAQARLLLGRSELARQDAQEALRIARQLQGNRPVSLHTGQALLVLAQVLDKPVEAAARRQAATEALKQLQPLLVPAHPDLASARALASSS